MAKGYERETRYYVGIHEKGEEISRFVIRPKEDGEYWMTEHFIDATHFETIDEAIKTIELIKELNPRYKFAGKNFVARRVFVEIDGFDLGTILCDLGL